MDARIRELQRQAALGDARARAALERILPRLGRDALRYTGPCPTPEVGPEYDEPVLYQNHPKSGWFTLWGTPATRIQARAKRYARNRSHRCTRQRVRNALRRGGRGRAMLEEW